MTGYFLSYAAVVFLSPSGDGLAVSICRVFESFRLHTSVVVIVLDSPFRVIVRVVLMVSFLPSEDQVATDLLSPIRELFVLSLPSREYLEVTLVTDQGQ